MIATRACRFSILLFNSENKFVDEGVIVGIGIDNVLIVHLSQVLRLALLG
jgi:hypothetical protein